MTEKTQQAEQTQASTGQERAIAAANQQVADLKRRLEVKKDEIRFLIGDDVRSMKLMMSALMIAADDPNIRKCDPNSIVRAVIQAALCDAEIAAGLGEGYLVPYWNKDLGINECEFMPGYRLGQRKIQEATGLRVTADVRYDKDHWRYSQVPLVLEHTPAEGDRGERVLGYAVAVDDKGMVMFAQIVTAKEIETAKALSRKSADKDSPAWRNWEDRMWRKVAIMRLAKEVRAWRPSEALSRVVEADDAVNGGHRQALDLLPEARVLPPLSPPEGRAMIGATQKKRGHEDQQQEPEPDHDPKTGEVKGPPKQSQIRF